jgi:ElaB/YqjD/DUF883 family membrane-anchored ribosome-binding protein
MERTTTMSGSGNANSNLANPVNSKLDDAAQAAHIATDKIADRADVQVDRSSLAVHRAVDNAADATMSAVEWASTIAGQAKQVHAQLTESASTTIRARPIAMVASALVVGYLIGRLARL